MKVTINIGKRQQKEQLVHATRGTANWFTDCELQ